MINKDEFVKIDNDKEQLMSHLTVFAKRESLKGFEQIKNFILGEPFTVENGLVTPTLKKRRAIIQKQYQERLEELYNNEK